MNNTTHVTTAHRAPSSNEPMLEIFSRWEVASREWIRLSNAGEDWDGLEMKAVERERWSLRDQMLETKVETLPGLLCQIRLLWEECGLTSCWPDQLERSDPELRLKCLILLGAEHLTNAPSWLPIDPKMLSAEEF